MRITDVKLLGDRGYVLQEMRPSPDSTSTSIVGEGAYSKVQLFKSTPLQKNVAIKIINKASAPRDFVQHFLPREIEVLQRIRHRFIVEIYEILATNDGRVFIAMEYAVHGDLLKHIQLNGAIDQVRARYLFNQLAKAINYLHKKNIVHRDLKCENLLLTLLHEELPRIQPPPPEVVARDSDCSLPSIIKEQEAQPPRPSVECTKAQVLPANFDIEQVKLVVTDFGFSKHFQHEEERSRTFCGSAAYAAPEIIKGEPYRLKDHDMWSLGIVLFIMVCGTMPYDDSNVKKMLHEQLCRRVRFPAQAAQNVTAECKDLIYKLIQPMTHNRWDIDQVLSHPFLTMRPDMKPGVPVITKAIHTTMPSAVPTETIHSVTVDQDIKKGLSLSTSNIPKDATKNEKSWW